MVEMLCCRLSDSEAKSHPAYKQEPVSVLPAGGAAVPMSAPVRKWLRLLRLEEAALHQDIKRHALAQAYSKAQSIQKRKHYTFRHRFDEKPCFVLACPVSPSMSFMSIRCPSIYAGCCCLSCFAACSCCQHSLQRHACIVSSGSMSQNPGSFVTQLFQLLYPFDESQTVCTHWF